jgi:putative flippase GtrA
VATAVADIKGIARPAGPWPQGRLPMHGLRQEFGREPLAGVPVGLPRQLVRFAAIGVASTLAYLVLYALLRIGLGPQAANLTALLVTAVANTAANRRLTFGVRGRERAARHHLHGLLIFAIGLALTSGSLTLLAAVAGNAPRVVELAVLTMANLVATLVRFLLLRLVFRKAPTKRAPAYDGRSQAANDRS